MLSSSLWNLELRNYADNFQCPFVALHQYLGNLNVQGAYLPDVAVTEEKPVVWSVSSVAVPNSVMETIVASSNSCTNVVSVMKLGVTVVRVGAVHSAVLDENGTSVDNGTSVV